MKNLLTIAGSDSSGGAGIQADLKTFAANGGYGMSVITAVTAQNTTGVSAVHNIPPEIVRAQIDAVFNDINVDGVYSSPYLRAIKTVEPIAKSKSLNVQLLDQFRERKSSDYRVSKEKFLGYGKHQWDDFDFKLCGGESLNDVKNRYNTGVRIIINQHAQSQNCIFAVGCHIAGLCAYISQFNLISNYEEYKKYASKMPLIVKCFYKNLKFVSGEICNFK